MDILATYLGAVKHLAPRIHRDARGSFSETFNERGWAAAGISCAFVQDNQAVSNARGTVRGLHFQIAPFAQAKLVRVARGAIFDVAVDLRAGSATFGRHAAVQLSAENGHQLFIPHGFAHGYCTISDETVVLYKTDNYYSPQHERGLRWNDPALAIDWPVKPDETVLSAKDRALPLLKDLKVPLGS